MPHSFGAMTLALRLTTTDMQRLRCDVCPLVEQKLEDDQEDALAAIDSKLSAKQQVRATLVAETKRRWHLALMHALKQV